MPPKAVEAASLAGGFLAVKWLAPRPAGLSWLPTILQLHNIRRDPARFVFGELPAGLILIIDIRHFLPAAVLHSEGTINVLD